MTLTNDDVAIIKGMLLRGDDQHHIAALFGKNSGRIAEIASGMNGKGDKTATGNKRTLLGQDVAPAIANLPPPGPYHLNLRAPRDIILVAIENALDPLALHVNRLEHLRPRDEKAIQDARTALAELHVAAAERKRELWKGRNA